MISIAGLEVYLPTFYEINVEYFQGILGKLGQLENTSRLQNYSLHKVVVLVYGNQIWQPWTIWCNWKYESYFMKLSFPYNHIMYH